MEGTPASQARLSSFFIPIQESANVTGPTIMQTPNAGTASPITPKFVRENFDSLRTMMNEHAQRERRMGNPVELSYGDREEMENGESSAHCTPSQHSAPSQQQEAPAREWTPTQRHQEAQHTFVNLMHAQHHGQQNTRFQPGRQGFVMNQTPHMPPP